MIFKNSVKQLSCFPSLYAKKHAVYVTKRERKKAWTPYTFEKVTTKSNSDNFNTQNIEDLQRLIFISFGFSIYSI